jgi:hypothetical protein
MDKQYRTRDGREVRIYAVDCGGDYSVHGAFRYDDHWRSMQWTESGSPYVSHLDDSFKLIEVKPRIQKEMWLNIYGGRQGMTTAFDTKVDCDNLAAPNRIACVKITIDCEEGEGL